MAHCALKLMTRPEIVCITPAGTQSKSTISTRRCAGVRAINCAMAPNAKNIARPTLPTHTQLTARLESRRPTNNMVAAPASGNSGISQMLRRKNSVGMPKSP